MRTKSLTPLACLLAAAVIILPACGGDEPDAVPASQAVPREQVQGVEQRVGDLEKELFKLRRELEGVRNEQSKPAPPPPDPNAGADAEAGDQTSEANVGTDSGQDPGSGSGSGSGSGGRSSGGRDEGGGPDPGTTEDDPSIKDICGENPAPTC